MAEQALGERQPADGPAVRGDGQPEIVVRARMDPILAYPPERTLTPAEIAAYGSSDLNELLDRLARSAGANGAGSLVVLIDGKRVRLASVAQLPPEAVARIDVLPEPAGVSYGRPPSTRVVNVRLRRDFAALTGELEERFPLRLGRSEGSAELNRSTVTPQGRTILEASYERDTLLRESERGLGGSAGRGRTLLGSREKVGAEFSISREMGGVSVGMYGDISRTDRLSLVGERSGPGDRGALRQDGRTLAASGGFSLDGSAGTWSWSAIGDLLHLDRRVATERPAGGGGTVREQSRSRSWYGTIDLLFNGPVARLPAGEATASFDLEAVTERYREEAIAGASAVPGRFSREGLRLDAGMQLPLLGAQAPTGQLAADLSGELHSYSGFAMRAQGGVGLTWRPVKAVSLRSGYNISYLIPDIEDVSSMVVTTPNVVVFDFARGRPALVEQVSGGNPLLREGRRREWRLSLDARPLAALDWRIKASWRRTVTDGPVGSLPVALPEVEAVFPARFVRGPQGELLRIDSRPVDFDRSRSSVLTWGMTYNGRIGPAPPEGAEEADERGTLRLSLSHTWRLEDTLRLAPGGPVLDYLDGDAVGLSGGRPRHEVRAEAAVYRNRIGAELDLAWEQGTRLRGAGPAGGDLAYDDRLQVDARVFFDLARASSDERGGSGRISLAVENLFDDRPTVRDAAGRIPAGLEPARLDPLGRTVKLGLRLSF